MSDIIPSPLAPNDPRHGRAIGYKLGCRCVECAEYKRLANTKSYGRRLKAKRGYGFFD